VTWRVGAARREINPPPGVELAGLGYYLNRTWQRVRDNLTAAALVVTDEQDESLALVALDVMYNDAAFTARIRELAARSTDLRPSAICVNCSHTHNAPTAGFIRGCGERDPAYLETVANAAASALSQAWEQRQASRLFAGFGQLEDMTFNRAQAGGPTDTRVSVLRAESLTGRPLAAVVNFHSHCTAHMEMDLRAISRDWPGEVVDQLEAALPGAVALYLQGTCGDVNFRREFNGTARRFEPAQAVSRVALEALRASQPVAGSEVACASRRINLPTRSWRREEVMRVREETLHRLRTGDTNGWLDGLARVCVNQPERLPLRYCGSVAEAVAAIARFGAEWTDEVLPRLDKQPEALEVEVQALRIGEVFVAAHPAELFTSLGLDLRRRWPHEHLFVLGYSNGSIGYLPDAAEIERGGYAALQSPRFTGQAPFTPESGPRLIEGLLRVLEEVAGSKS
jgi:hypothetical protein